MRGEMDWPRIMGTVFAISLVHLLFSYAFKERAPFGGWPVAGAQGIQGAINGIWVVGGIVMLIVVSWALMKRGEAREGAEKARTGSGWLSNRWRDLLRRAGLGRLREEWGKLYNRPGMEPEIMYRNRLLVMRVYDQALRYDIYIQKMRAFKKTVLDINTDRAQAGQKPYKAIEQEYVDYRSKQAQADWARMADKEMVVGWSFLTRESVNTLNAVYDGLGRNPTSSDIEAWTSALDALKARLEASFKEHETKRRYLENYHPLRAEIMRLPLFQLSPRDEIRFVRTYALEGSSRNVEAEMMQEWSQFMKDYQYGTQHPASRTVGEYIDAWKRGIFNDNALTGEPKGGGEGDPAFDWRALSTGKYTWEGMAGAPKEPHISVFGLWQFFNSLIDRISGQTEEDKRKLREITPYSSLEHGKPGPGQGTVEGNVSPLSSRGGNPAEEGRGDDEAGERHK